MANLHRFMLILAVLLFAAASVCGQSAWTKENSGVRTFLRTVIWADSQCVVVGDSGVILTSGDGKIWTKRLSGTTCTLKSVAWNGAAYVIGGDSAFPPYRCFFLASGDGYSWTKNPGQLSCRCTMIIWTGSRFVALGDSSLNGTVRTEISSSADGAAWTRTAWLNDYYTISIAWNGTRLCAGGYNWYSVGTCSASMPLMRTSGMIRTSPDGVVWTDKYFGTNTATDSTKGVSSVVWNGSQFVAVGFSKFALCPALQDSAVILTSPDGDAWTTRDSHVPGFLHSVAWSGSRLAAVGGGGAIIGSPDGVSWHADSSGTSLTLNRVCWAGNKFVAVGDSGTILTSPEETVKATQKTGANETTRRFDVKISGSTMIVNLPCSFKGSLVRVKIYSMTGKKIMSFTGTSVDDKVVFDIYHLGSGLYQVVCENETMMVKRALVICR